MYLFIYNTYSVVINLVLRKVHDVKGSFMIYLPKNWAKNSGIAQIKEIDMEELTDGRLILSPSSHGINNQNNIAVLSLDLSNSSNYPIKWDFIQKMVIAGYIVGVDKIIIKNNLGLTTSQREEISLLLRNLFGFEISTEDAESITIQSIGESTELPLLLSRTFSTVKLMFDATREAVNSQDTNEISAIVRRDDDVDRFRLLIERQTHRFLVNHALAPKLGISLIEALHISQIAKFAERLADHLVQIAEILRESKLIATDKTKLTKAFDKTSQIFANTIELITSKNMEKGFTVFENRQQLQMEWKEVTIRDNPLLSILIRHLERIVDYCSDIIEIIIDSDIYSEINFGEIEEK